MGRKLFCELSPAAYRISVWKCRGVRALQNLANRNLSKRKSKDNLPVVIYRHSSLIQRRLGDVDPVLQQNKAVNLAIAAPKVDGILIYPGETFSFWSLVGSCTKRKGYRDGLVIRGGKPDVGMGGGICQFTNLIHFMVLHSPLTITEHHHHDNVDLFPDYGRKVPFGTGTSVLYNYLDYRFYNGTDNLYQLRVFVDGEYLKGELRAKEPLPVKYHIRVEDEHFSEENGVIYRNNVIYRTGIDKRTGAVVFNACIKKNHAKVMYDLPKEALDRIRGKS